MREAWLLVVFLIFAHAPTAAATAPNSEREAEERVQQLRKEKRYKEALAFLDLAVSESPQSGNLRGLYCWIYLSDLKDPKTALDYALRLKQDIPNDRGGYYWAAKSYDALGDYARCTETLRGFRPYGKDFERDNLLATCYYKNHQYEDALSALPGEEELRGSYEKYEGWSLWLKGQMARRKVFTAQKERLKAQATAPGSRERSIAMIKLGILGLPECGELVKAAGAAGKGELRTVAANLAKELEAAPLFHKEKPVPGVSDARGMPLEKALAEIWKELDTPPGTGKIPAIEGKFMTPQMIEMAKSYPSAAQPLAIQVNTARDQFSLGLAYVAARGDVDTSYEPGRWFTIVSVQDGAVCTISVHFSEKSVTYGWMAYRPEGQDLAIDTRNWIDGGDEFFVREAVTSYRRVP